MNNLMDSTHPIWTIISASLGGVITYFSTRAHENRKNHKIIQQDATVQVLLPLAKCIGNTREKIKLIKNSSYYSEPIMDSSIKEFDLPLQSLQIEKKIYLSRKMIGLLEQYDEYIEQLKDVIIQQSSICVYEYSNYMCKLLKQIYNEKAFDKVAINLNQIGKEKIICSLLINESFSLIDFIESVSFGYYGDTEGDGSEYFSIDPQVKFETEEILCGTKELSDVTNQERAKNCEMRRSILEYRQNELDFLENLVEQYGAKDLIDKIDNVLVKIDKQLVREIKKKYGVVR